MASVAENLTRIREKLHDASGTFWSDDELVRWFNDAYEMFCSKTRCVTELYQMDLPPRYAYTYCHEWEDTFTSQGPSRMMMLPALNGTYRCTSAWEVEFIEGVEPTESLPGITQLWERSLMDTDRHYQITLPQNHEIIQAVRFDNKVLYPLVTKELDEFDTQWYRHGTQPHWWTNGTGRVNTVELYEIQTEYQQAYAPIDYEDFGFARTFSGSRTYAVDSSVSNAYGYTSSGDGQVLDLSNAALLSGLGWRFTLSASNANQTFCTHIWEEEHLEGSTTFSSSTGYVCTYHWEAAMLNQTLPAFGVGTIRSIESSDRQYWAQNAANSAAYYGGIRQFQSSEEALEIWHTVVPRVDLNLNDSPDLLPKQAEKYLRYYVLAHAFGRGGPGTQPALAAHYQQRFNQGVDQWKKLANVAQLDQTMIRDTAGPGRGSRPPLVRLPAQYDSL